MRTIKMTALIGSSIEDTAKILFRPFSIRKWSRLLFIGLLAGVLSFGNGSGGGNKNTQENSAKPETTTQGGVEKSAPSGAVSGQEARTGTAAQTPAVGQPSRSLPTKGQIKVILIVIAVILILLAPIFLLFLWIGARFRFVWFNAIATNSDAVMEPYSRHTLEAGSLFKFSIGITLAFIVFSALLIGGTLYNLFLLGAFKQGFVWTLSFGLKTLLLPALFFIAVIGVLVIIGVIVDTFIVPIMALDKVTIGEGSRRFSRIFKSQWKDILLFFLVEILLTLVTGIMQMIAVIIVLIAAGLLGLIIFGGLFLLIVSLLKAKLVFIVIAIVLGIPYVIAALLTMFSTALPIAVFFRKFSINYLLSLGSGYTQASIDAYASRRAEKIAGKAPLVVAVTFICLIVLIAIIGLMAAIAIPNFIKARQAALEKKNITAHVKI